MGKSLRKHLLVALCIAAQATLTISTHAQNPGEASVGGAGSGTIPLVNPASGNIAPPAVDNAAPASKPKKSKKHSAAKLDSAQSGFKGKLSAVDKSAMTITVDGSEKRLLKITSRTHINKDGKPALLAQGQIGDTVSGIAVKSTDGSEEASVVNFGIRPAAAKSKTHKSKTPKTAPDGLAPATDNSLPATSTETNIAPIKSP